MAFSICEPLCLKFPLRDLGVNHSLLMKLLFCDNKAARDIAHNPVQHDRTKHVKVDRFFIKEKLEEKKLNCPQFGPRIKWLIYSQRLVRVTSSQASSTCWACVTYMHQL